VTPGLGALVVTAGVLTGVLSALFGVGGGLVMVPFMVLVLDSSQHLAEGTSLVVIVPTAIAGVVSHLRRRYVLFGHAALVAAGGLAGAYLGADLALRIEADALTQSFAAFLAIMGARTIYQGARTMRAADK
jgi:uncharacterized protein